MITIGKREVILEGNYRVEASLTVFSRELTIFDGGKSASYEMTKDEAQLLSNWLLTYWGVRPILDQEE
jgi:hypothetical protein